MRSGKRQQGHSSRRVFWLGILVFGFLLPVAAGAREGTPMDRVQGTLDGALRILKDPALQGPEKKEEQRRQIRKLIASRFNYAEMAERSLDSHWNTLTGQQRRDFADLFGELFERSYSRLVLDSLPKQQILYAGESVDGARAVVNTVIVDKRGDRLPVDYQLQQQNGRWDLYDVVIDGVSIVTNYQSQFNKIIRTSSFDDLVKRMRIKRDED